MICMDLKEYTEKLTTNHVIILGKARSNLSSPLNIIDQTKSNGIKTLPQKNVKTINQS